MMKIILFDTTNRADKLIKKNFDEIKKKIFFIQNKIEFKEIIKEDINMLFVHISDIDKDEIENLCRERKIKLVYFSGGEANIKLRRKETPSLIMNVESFYERLSNYIINVESNPDLGRLAFGENYFLNELLNLRMYLFYYQNEDQEEIYEKLKDKDEIDIDSIIKRLDFKSRRGDFGRELYMLINKKIDNFMLFNEPMP